MKKLFKGLFSSLILAPSIGLIPVVVSCKNNDQNPYIDFRNLRNDYTDGKTVAETKKEGDVTLIEHYTYWTIDNLIWKKKDADIEDLQVQFVSVEDEDISKLSIFNIELNEDFKTSHKFSLIFKSLADWQLCCYHISLSFFSSPNEDVPFYETEMITLAAEPLFILESEYQATKQTDEITLLLQPCNFDYNKIDNNNQMTWTIYIGTEDVITDMIVGYYEEYYYRYVTLTFSIQKYRQEFFYHGYISFMFTNGGSEYNIWNDFYFIKLP